MRQMLLYIIHPSDECLQLYRNGMDRLGQLRQLFSSPYYFHPHNIQLFRYNPIRYSKFGLQTGQATLEIHAQQMCRLHYRPNTLV